MAEQEQAVAVVAPGQPAIAKPKPTKLNQYLPALEEMINRKLGSPNAFEVLSMIISANEVLLAGGSVLQIIAGYPSAQRLDLDFYCPTRNLPKFIKELTEPIKRTHTKAHQVLFGQCSMSVIGASLYCNSFLKRNGIRKVYTLSRIENSPEAAAAPRPVKRKTFAQMIDIMSVRNSRSPIDVVENFDLTFCQVWWDGKDIWATYPDDITEKRGTLQKDYSNLFIKGNPFLRKRVQKYKDRGFAIKLDVTASALTVDDILNRKGCISPTASEDRSLDPEYLQRWSTRFIMKWLVGVRNGSHNWRASEQIKASLKQAGINVEDVLALPRERRFRNERNFIPNQNGNIFGKTVSSRPEEFTLEEDAGYDSDDYTEVSELKDLAFTMKHNSPNNLVPQASRNKDLYYYRSANILLRNTLYPYWYAAGPNLGYKIYAIEDYPDEYEPTKRALQMYKRYKDSLTEFCTRKSSCFITLNEDETVYDIHNHPLEGAISQDGLEGYLRDYLRYPDKTSVPCYYKPNPPSQHNPRPEGNCYKHLSLAEVNMIVSNAFYKKYSKPVPIKTGLGETIGAWNTTLTNVKTHNAQFGDIYTKTICPFCLQFAERSSGCAFMGHENPKGLSAEHYPYCQPEFVVDEVRDKYFAAAEELDPDVPPHLEWCVECGRPSMGHEHFTTTDPLTKVAPPRIPIPGNPGHMQFDYGTCTGGGRAELFARILAIRRIYRDMAIDDPKTERLTAALAADEAPNDPELMALGRAIAAQELADRKWGNAPIPENKIYNDPAYRNNNNNNNNAAPYVGLNAPNLAGGARKTRKRNQKRPSSRRRR